MSYQVISYEVAEQLMLKDSIFAKYSDAIHITATNSLKRGMMESNTDLSQWFVGPILSFSEIAKFVGKTWTLGQTELRQFTLLSKALRKYNETHEIQSSDLFSSIDKNQATLLKTMRLLTESGLTSKEVKEIGENKFSEEEKVFLNLWSDLEIDSTFENLSDWFDEFQRHTIYSFKETLTAALRDLEQMDEKRMNANIKANTNINKLVQEKFVEKKVIILHGFYFITPIQKRIFDQLSKHLNVIHVVNYKEGYHNGFKSVEAFLDLPNTPHVKASQTKLPVNIFAKKFLQIINGSFPKDEEEQDNQQGIKPSYFEFMNLHEFKEYVDSKDDVVISPRSREAKSYLEDIYTSNNKNLTEYPMGQFLMDVHRLNTRIYHIDTRTYEDVENLSVPLVLRLFNSGYFMIEGETASKYLKTLQKLTPLLEEYTTFYQWKKQIKNLFERKKEIETKLKKENKNKNQENDIDHKMNTFYNRNLAFFNVPYKELIAIQKGLANLQELYQRLYTGNSIPISEYVDILEKYVNDDILPSLEQRVDQTIAGEILDSLEDLKGVSVDNFDRQDLVRGLNFFLSRETDTREDGEASTIFGDNSVNSYETISRFLDSDGFQFTENRSVHLAFMDNKAFPVAQQLSTWPLSKETLDELYSKNINLKQLKMRKDLEVDISCYLLYITINNAINVKFSIVKEYSNEKNLQQTFYLQLLNLKKASEKDIRDEDNEQQPITPTFSKKIMFRERAYEYLIRKTYNRCPKRVVYSFLINNRPEFSGPFHEPFVFKNLLRHAMGNKYKRDQRYQDVYSWFPHWSETKKDMYRKNIEEYMRDKSKRPNFTMLDGERYWDSQLNIALFGERSPNEGNEADYEFDKPNKPFAKPGPNCKYCPFQEHCIEAQLYDKY
ncbi:hypothetical protein [Aquibacillus sediminis]|uniref:hypothetical protein n=1 Tax=Aquibacillus sediminis TaxID=2574734 RepID=UPI0011099612|nr:hypothetical protein [Aquibacillus sediminis]